MTENAPVSFRGGWVMSFVPLLIFLVFCVVYFVVFQAFDMTALAMAGFLGLLAGAPFAREYQNFWDAVMRGIGSRTAVAIVVILFVVGMFSALVKASDVSGGFVWLADTLGLSGALFTFFAFVAVSLVAVSTGSSIGTMFTAFPIFYPAGVLLGADPGFLAGAILSGAILGDNLAPISDTTIISASTQRYRRRSGVADIGGIVTARFRYAAAAACVSAIGFLTLGGGEEEEGAAGQILQANMNPTGLYMLLPVGLTIVVALRSRDIFKAITVGLLTGTITALLAGLISPGDILHVEDGEPGGFLLAGVKDLIGTIALVLAVFGIMGVLRSGGLMERLVDWISGSRFSRTPAGAEAAIGLGASAFTVLFGGVNSASMITFGPVADEIGSRAGLHPYRRANVMDCFAMGVSCVVPFLSAFLFIGSLLVTGYEFIDPLSAPQLFVGSLYPLALTVVLVGAVATGWGRRFEGAAGVPVRRPDTELTRDVPSDVLER